MVPEWCNVIGATLYLIGAAGYDRAFFDPEILHHNHVIETIAATVEVCAAFGWTYVWWHTHVRGPGRGLTLDDPDFSGNILIVVPSLIYLAYNINNLRDPANYTDGINSLLYQTADLWYAIGAGVYVLAALRDDGWYTSFRIFGGATFGMLNALAAVGFPCARHFAEWLRADEGGGVGGGGIQTPYRSYRGVFGGGDGGDGA